MLGVKTSGTSLNLVGAQDGECDGRLGRRSGTNLAVAVLRHFSVKAYAC